MRRLCLALLFTIACDKSNDTAPVPPPDATPAEPVADQTEATADTAEPEAEEPPDPRANHTRACEEEGKAEVCTALAVMWERGRDGPQDEAKARGYYETACDGGHQLACFNLANMLNEGRGGDADVPKALEYLVGACEADTAEYKDACLSAAIINHEKDATKARELYDKACEAGELTGCAFLGQLMILGEGGKKDAKGARTLFEKACDGGQPQGCYSLALALQKGLGGKKDKKRAKELKAKACEGGVKQAC